MKLIVGLGNPGEKFKQTRHNAGFIMLDRLAEKSGITFSENKKVKGEIAKTAEKIFLKPGTFMNLSGQSVKAALAFYKIETSDLIVIHDDLDINLGKFKKTESSRSAGHNGVQSIINELGTQDFCRYRLGIKPKQQLAPTEKFVLEKFKKNEMEELSSAIAQATEKF